jgi:hypothetical protein
MVLKRLLGDECVEELRERLEARPAPAAGGTKKAAKVDREAEIDASAKHVSKVTTGWISARSRSQWPALAAASSSRRAVRVHRFDRHPNSLRRNGTILCSRLV